MGLNGSMTDVPQTQPKSEKEALFELALQGADAWNNHRRQTSYGVLDLSGIDFTGKDLTGFNFSNTNLSGCIFDFAYLSEAKLVMCQMNRCSARETDFHMAVLDEAELLHADLYKSNFAGASLTEAILTGASAQEANFAEADLTQAVVNKGIFTDADFSGANLQGTDFTDSDLSWANLDGIQSDAATKWGKNDTAESADADS